MATQTFHSKIAAQAASASGEVIIKSQHDTDIAAAKLRSNHTGTQTISTISDAQTYVDGRIQLIVDAAPAALDTLNELAAALGDDPNFSATVTSSLNGHNTRLNALEASATAGSYKVNIGDAVASTFTITHSLATLDVRVEVVQVSTGQTVYPVVTRPSTNTVTLDFGSNVPASASHRVLVSAV